MFDSLSGWNSFLAKSNQRSRRMSSTMVRSSAGLIVADIPVLTVHWSLLILMPAFQQATPKRREERTGIVCAVKARC